MSVRRAKGQHAVSRLVYEETGRLREILVSAVGFDGLLAPATELLGQLGARVTFDAERSYAPRLLASGEAAPGVFSAGSCAASSLSSAEDGARVARAILGELGA